MNRNLYKVYSKYTQFIFSAEEQILPVLAFEAHSHRAESVCDPPSLLLLKSERMLFVSIHLPGLVKQSSVMKK